MDITNPAAAAPPPVEGGIPVQVNSAAPTEVPKPVDGLGTSDHVDNSLNGNPGGLEGALNQQPDEVDNIGGLAAKDAVSAPVAPAGPPAAPPTPTSEVTAPGVEVLPNPDGQAPEASLGVLDQTAEQAFPASGAPLPPPVEPSAAGPLTPPDSTLTAPAAPVISDMAPPAAMPEPPVFDATAPLPAPIEAPMPPAAEGEMTEEQIIEGMDALYQEKEKSNMKDAEIDQQLRDLWEKYKQLQSKNNPDQGISKVA